MHFFMGRVGNLEDYLFWSYPPTQLLINHYAERNVRITIEFSNCSIFFASGWLLADCE